jgi:hypothetical protein
MGGFSNCAECARVMGGFSSCATCGGVMGGFSKAAKVEPAIAQPAIKATRLNFMVCSEMILLRKTPQVLLAVCP